MEKNDSKNEVLELHQKLHKKIAYSFLITAVTIMFFRITLGSAMNDLDIGTEMKEAVKFTVGTLLLITGSLSLGLFFYFIFTIPTNEEGGEEDDNGNIP